MAKIVFMFLVCFLWGIGAGAAHAEPAQGVTLPAIAGMPSGTMPILPMPMEPFRVEEAEEMVFGFPGTECPKGSEVYGGPEAMTTEADGVVYCVFIKKYRPVLKAATKGTCPGGGKSFQADGFEQDDDVIWCDSNALMNPKPLGTKPIRNVPPAKFKK